MIVMFGLIIVVLSSIVIRVWGIGQQLPYIYHPDEPVHFGNILHVLRHEKVTAEYYSYPPLFYSAEVGFLRLSPKFTTQLKILSGGNAYITTPWPIILARLLNVLLSVGTVIIVFMAARTITNNPYAAFFSSLLIAFSPLSVENSRVVTPDTLTGLLVTAAMYFVILFLKTGKVRYYVFAGLISGLAISSKYNAVFVIIPVSTSFILRNKWKSFHDWRFYALPLFTALGFFAGAPQILLHLKQYRDGFIFINQYYASGHAGAQNNNLAYYFFSLIQKGIGGLVFGFVGMVFGLRHKKGKTLVFGLLVGGYLLFLSMYKVHFDRNLVIILGPLYILASLGIWELSQRVSSAMKKFILTGLLVLFLVIYLAADVNILRESTRDNRAAARTWIEKHIPKKSHIVVESYGPWVSSRQYAAEGVNSLLDYSPQDDILHPVDYLVAAEGSYGKYFQDSITFQDEVNRYNALFLQYPLLAQFDEYGYHIKIFRVDK